MKLQLPKLLTTRPAFLTRKGAKPKPATKLNAATASQRMKPGVDDYDDDEPQTRLSSAFFVVLILHVVAVGGIYAFNSIKAHRRGLEPTTVSAKPVIEKPAAEPVAAPAKTRSVPVAETPAKTATASAPAQVTTTPVSNAKIYHVKPNDTLSKIAASLNVSVAELQFVNSPKELATLRPGQIINVPPKRATETAALVEPPAPNPTAKKTTETAAKPAGASTYDVQKGDTATSIAKRFGVTVDDLLKLNKVADPKKLQLGQTLKIPSKKN
jgi:LysM repeat protein